MHALTLKLLRALLPDAADQFTDSVYYALRLGRGPRSFTRYLMLLIGARAPVEVSLRGLDHPVLLRPATTDAEVAFGTLGRGYHLPPVALADDAVIIDLGANIGLTAADFATRYRKATVVAVEMDEANAAMAVANTASYGHRVVVIHAAAWWEETSLSYSAEPGDEWGFAISDNGARKVMAVSVLDLVSKYGPVDFLKVDIEGAEREVLAKNTGWASAVAAIQVEVHEPYTMEQCEADLQSLGFATQRHPMHPLSVNATRLPAG